MLLGGRASWLVWLLPLPGLWYCQGSLAVHWVHVHPAQAHAEWRASAASG